MTNLAEDELSRFQSKQQEHLLKFRKDLEETKRRKWHRDLMDYQLGRVYTWNSQQTTPFIRNKRQYNNKNEVNPADNANTFFGARPDRKESVDIRDVEDADGANIIKTRNSRHPRNIPQRNTPKK